ncbi:EcsC family protein [Phaeovulum vinaykumarii]|uniref:EcsC protein family protein n=1 Tax=Phaeovulum vinaykumarii TaxID=407234 RepID=A0A1N7MUY6_9RHOB|nr:EcsC family protein [Phaeovulum vinaykumarii]SIS89669.1 EcsC protein family protein [Phaeovulum vinaykumarii]SOC18288.1 EcsC family protein [Phaeovulum vinaykumarii]
MTGTELREAVIFEPISDPQVLGALEALAARHRAASGLGMQVLSMVGASAEGLLRRLPGPVRARLDHATEVALERAFHAAAASRGSIADQSDWVNTALATAMGAAGGLGGLPGALAELPFTITVLLRAIQGIAEEHGFDPADPEVRLECLQVMAAAGPLARDDGADVGFLALKVTLTGQSLNTMIARVAPRLAAAMGQKLAAQSAPVLGAVAGAAINWTFTSYYQEIARVHFGLRRLARDQGLDEGLMREELRARILAR